MIVHLLRLDQTYIKNPIALCGVVVDRHDAQLARGLRATCRECLDLEKEDDDLAAQLQQELYDRR